MKAFLTFLALGRAPAEIKGKTDGIATIGAGPATF